MKRLVVYTFSIVALVLVGVNALFVPPERLIFTVVVMPVMGMAAVCLVAVSSQLIKRRIPLMLTSLVLIVLVVVGFAIWWRSIYILGTFSLMPFALIGVLYQWHLVSQRFPRIVHRAVRA